jgi:hypothetical protein
LIGHGYRLGADKSIVSADGSKKIALPFAFSFNGRTMTDISVNTNGLVELLQAAENCLECAGDSSFFKGGLSSQSVDAFLLANDVLATNALVDSGANFVRVTWMGTTKVTAMAAGNFITYPIIASLMINNSGVATWKFLNLTYTQKTSLFSGIFDGPDRIAFEVPGGSQPAAGSMTGKKFTYTP